MKEKTCKSLELYKKKKIIDLFTMIKISNFITYLIAGKKGEKNEHKKTPPKR